MSAADLVRTHTDLSTGPSYHTESFEGPLDLLCHLIEKNRIDIYDIPIDRITDQYLAYLETMQPLDMDIASEFIVMAATLLHIKSRLLLPQKNAMLTDEGEDPREELVMRLLAYRRCKTLAGQLHERHETYLGCRYRPPETTSRLGINRVFFPESLDRSLFWEACRHIVRQNQVRFNDLSGRMTHILKRDKVSLKEKMQQVLQQVLEHVRIFFHEIFPAGTASRTEQVTGFLAVLELLRQNRIRVRQDHPFDVMLIEPDPDWHEHGTLDDLEDPEDPEESGHPEKERLSVEPDPGSAAGAVDLVPEDENINRPAAPDGDPASETGPDPGRDSSE